VAPITNVINISNFGNHVGYKEYYSRFLAFFEEEVRIKRWDAVIIRYLLEGDALAEDLITRQFYT
jgi:hypothetical protein